MANGRSRFFWTVLSLGGFALIWAGIAFALQSRVLPGPGNRARMGRHDLFDFPGFTDNHFLQIDDLALGFLSERLQLGFFARLGWDGVLCLLHLLFGNFVGEFLDRSNKAGSFACSLPAV